jgi:chromosome segregation ATPase
MENVELRGKIAELQQKLSTPVPRKEQPHSGSPSKKEQELSALLEQVNRQLENAERARRQLTVEVERLTAQKTRLERDMAAQKDVMEEQKEQLQKSQKEKEELEQKITLLMEQVSVCVWHKLRWTMVHTGYCLCPIYSGLPSKQNS